MSEQPLGIDVPEGFDLDEARQQPTTTPADQLKRCPNCGSVKVVSKAERCGGTFKGVREFDPDYFCDCCHQHFDEPKPPRGGLGA